MNLCTVCYDPNVRIADNLINQGMAASIVARKLGLSAQALRRHIRNGHVVKPAQPKHRPGRELPDSLFDAAEVKWFENLSRLSGIPVDRLRACDETHKPGIPKHPRCESCDLLEASEPGLDQLFWEMEATWPASA